MRSDDSYSNTGEDSASTRLLSPFRRHRLSLGILMMILPVIAAILFSFFEGQKSFALTDSSLKALEVLELPETVITRLSALKGVKVRGEREFLSVVLAAAGSEVLSEGQRQTILAAARDTTEVWFMNILMVVYLLIGIFMVTSHFVEKRKERYAERREEVNRERLSSLTGPDFEKKFDEAKRLREEKNRADFLNNVKSSFVLQRLTLRQISFFSDSEWVFQPGINILLGRNGYGKSLLLSTLAALLTRDEEHSEHLLSNESSLDLRLVRNAQEVSIRREQHRFAESIGKVPILAIPDTRFLDRTDTTVGPAEGSYRDIREFGAYHFLHQTPYAGMIRALLGEMCLDYWEHRRTFDLPVFNFIRRVFTLITDEHFDFHSIERIGPTSFTIKVRTEGSDVPIPIQNASQGTLAVLAIFGLIRSFLKALHPEFDDENLLEKGAIVFIDEIDAHLHPTWQQRMTGTLRKVFPGIQFVVSAHSPLIVAGSLEREVAVLRKMDGGFGIEQTSDEFVGATARQIYDKLFDVKDADDSLRLHSSWKPLDENVLKRIRELDELSATRPLTADEQLEVAALKREGRVRRLAEAAFNEKQDESAVIQNLEAEVDRLKGQVNRASGNAGDSGR